VKAEANAGARTSKIKMSSDLNLAIAGVGEEIGKVERLVE